jgi:hypothetical protein
MARWPWGVISVVSGKTWWGNIYYDASTMPGVGR